MFGKSLHFALRETRGFFTNPRGIAILAALCVILGLSGPFQTYDILAFGPRLAYWTAITILTFGGGLICGTFGSHLAMAQLKGRYWPILFGGVFSGMAVSVVVIVINALAFGPGELDRFPYGTAFGYCVAIALTVSWLYHVFRDGLHSAPAELRPVAPRLMDRLEPAMRGSLISLSVTDHYVEVTTQKGKTLLLMRLADAMAETDGIDGLQIHRSHWVALDCIEKINRNARKTIIVTSAGDALPVSRTYLPDLRARNLI